MSEKKVVAGLSLDAGQFKQELEEVRQLEQQAAAGGESFARSFSEGFERIEERSRKMSATIQEGGKVSDRQFTELVATLRQLQLAAEASGKSIEEAPEPIRKAFDVARQQITAVAGGMQSTAAETARLRDQFMAAGKEAAGLATAADTAKVALAAVSEEEKKAADLAEQVAQKFGDIPERIEEIKAASDKTFDEQVESLKKVAKELADAEKSYKKLGDAGAPALAAIRVESGKVEAALKEVSAAAETNGARISDAALVAGRSMEKLAQQIRANPKEAVEQLPAAVGAVIQLKNAIEATKAAGGPVDPNAVKQLQRFEDQLGKTKQEIGNLKREIDQQTAGVTSASQAWQGFDSVVDGVAGKFGKFGAAAVGGFAALKEGWAIGHSIAEMLGTDFSAMEQSVEKFKEKARTLNPVLLAWATGDGSFADVRAAITLTKSEFEGYNSAVLAGIQGIDDYKSRSEDFAAIHAAHAKILAEGAEGQRLATEAKRDGAGVMDDYLRALQLASDAAEVHNQLVKAGAEGEALWDAMRKEGKGSLLDLAVVIKNNADAIGNLTTKTKEQVTAEQELATAVNNTAAARERGHKWDVEQARLLGEQETATDGLTESIRNKLAEITASMTVEEGRLIPLTKMQIAQLQELIERNLTLTETERKKLQARVDQLKAVETLTQGQREMLAQDIQIDLQRNSSIEVDEKHKAVLDRKAVSISNAAHKTSMLSKEQIGFSSSTESAEEATKKLEGGFGRLGSSTTTVETGVRGLGEGLSAAAAEIEGVADPVEKVSKVSVVLGEALPKVAEGMKSLAVDPATLDSMRQMDAVFASLVANMQSVVAIKDSVVTAVKEIGDASNAAAGEE